jgi:pimeloyl-ACP methyl ester carboxylesterase
MTKVSTLIYALLIAVCSTYGQNLKRQASWPFRFSVQESGSAIITTLDLQSSAAKVGLRDNDQIVSINGRRIPDQQSVAQVKKEIKGGDAVAIVVKRGAKEITVSFIIPARPLEKYEGVDVTYGEVKTQFGYHVQTITTRPARTKTKLPGIFFVGWLSCDPVEVNPANLDGWAQLIQDFAAKSGMVFMRVEKPGMGDSGGPDCDQCDLEHDLAAYRAGFAAFKKMSFVDSTQLFVFGGSIGGALAPVLMQNEKLKGIIVANTFSRSWFEHFMDFERGRLELSGNASVVNTSMQLFPEFYTDYLIKKQTPGEVIKQKPYMAKVWYDEPTSQFGRPARYHHQVQQLDVAGAWQKLKSPVLVIYGQYDWIMSRQEHEYIVHLVNGIRPGTASLQVIPNMDHHFSIYKTPQEAFDGSYINYSKEVFPMIMNWIRSGS